MAPDILDNCGAGFIVAATVLCEWSHPGRIRNYAAFAMLAGTAPIPASSGMTVRHRLNRSGDRRLNQAIQPVVTKRMRVDPQTKAYQRRRAEGKRGPREQALPEALRHPPTLPATQATT